MSNSIAPGSSADVNVKVTALTTNPNVPVKYKTIILKKNLVNGVNTLTQEMVSATNTKYVIKYDYVLGENITIPDNCVLEFDGGGISGDSNGKNTITCNNTTFKGENIVFTNISLSGTLTNKTIKLSWVGGSISKILSIDPTDHIIAFDVDTTADATINYRNKNNIVFDGCNKEINVGADSILFALVGEYNNIEIKNFKFKGTTTSSFYSPSSGWDVIHDNIHIHHNNIDGCALGISLNSDLAGETINSSIHDNVVKVTYPGQDIGCYGIHTANANYCTIYNNYITGANRHAMYISWGHDIDISNNFFYRCGLSGDLVRGVLFVARKSQNINITNNIFKECGNVHLMIYHGENDNNRRTAGDLINVNVTGNTFENLRENEYNILAYHILIGYRAETNYDYIEKNINITGNIIKHLPASVSIGIHSGDNILVDTNIIVYDNTFEDLSAYNNNMAIEIASRDNDNYIKSITITNNTFDLCYGSAYCFYVEHLNTHFDELTIKNNTYLNEAIYHKNRNLSLEQFPNAIDLIPTKGISSERPSLGAYNIGWRYFDTTLDKPIYWNGTTWIDATGISV